MHPQDKVAVSSTAATSTLATQTTKANKAIQAVSFATAHFQEGKPLELTTLPLNRDPYVQKYSHLNQELKTKAQYQDSSDHGTMTAATMKTSTAVVTSIGTNDVLCGRHKFALNHTGNRRFRILVSISLKKYVDVQTTRREKSIIVKEIIESIQECGGRFLQYYPQNNMTQFTELTYHQAYQKCAVSSEPST
jgi:hypothetical protein